MVKAGIQFRLTLGVTVALVLIAYLIAGFSVHTTRSYLEQTGVSLWGLKSLLLCVEGGSGDMKNVSKLPFLWSIMSIYICAKTTDS